MVKKSAAIILTLVFMLSAFSGCAFLRTNSDRDMKQVIARVGDSEYSDDIYKRDLVNAYASQGASYEQSYGRNETINMLIDNLVNNRLIIQTAVSELIEIYSEDLQNANIANWDKKSTYLQKDEATGNRSTSLKKLLNVLYPNVAASDDTKEILGAVKLAESGVNKFYSDSLDYFEDLVKDDWKIGYKYMSIDELKALCEEYEIPFEKSATKDQLVALLEEYDEHKDHDHSFGEHGEDRPTKNPDVEEDEEFFENEGIPAEKLEDDSINPRFEAYKRMESELKRQEKTIDEYLEERFIAELENQLIEIYTEEQYKNMPISFAELKARYDNLLASQKQKYTYSAGDYTGTLSSATKDTMLLYNPLEGYGYVKNLLIGFGDIETAALNKLKAQNLTNELYKIRREEILLTLGTKDLRDVEESEKMPTYTTITDPVNGFYKKEIVDLFTGAVNKGDYLYQRTGISNDELSDFIDLIFAYNTDPGMFNNDIDYLSAPAVKPGEQEQFVQEFADAAREVVALGKGSFTMVGTDFGWHIILCTDKISVGPSGEPDQAELALLQEALESGTRYDKLPLSIRQTDTYKLYNLMREEVKSIYFGEKVEQILKDGKSNITRFEKAYKDLLA